MKSIDEPRPDLLTRLVGMDRRIPALAFLAMVLVGGISFWSGISNENAQRVWQAYLTNFLFWTGLAYGAVLFSAVLNMTNARWARPMKRLAEAPGAFLPFSFLFFLILYQGRENLFHWIHEPVHGKEWWLDVNWLFARDGVGIFLLSGVSLALIYFSVRSDLKWNAREGVTGREAEPEEVPGRKEIQSRHWRAQVVLSPVLGILYALVLTLMAVDLIMALDPHWISTLFGAYYFIGSFYTALAALFFMTLLARESEAFKDIIHPKHMHDLGKLLFGFCILTGDFFYSQFLVIWYGNLPEETRYVLLRIRQSPWELLAWTVLLVCFVIPFVLLLNRRIKMKPVPMMALSSVILLGMWLERFLLVAPSLWKGSGLPIGFTEISITAGFFGVMALCLMAFFRLFPLLPLSDPLFREQIRQVQTESGHQQAKDPKIS
jgi:hypothetical protein